MNKRVEAGETATVTALEQSPSESGATNVVDLTELLAKSLAKALDLPFQRVQCTADLLPSDVVGGQVPVFFGNLASTLQHIQSGKLRALAVTSGKRTPILPDVPTLAEAGVPGAEVYEWNVVLAPAGTPEAVIGKLSAALQKALDAPEVKARIATLGGEIQKGTPEAAQTFVNQQIALWARVVKARGITLE